MQEMIIGPNQAGQRLDKFLHKCLPEAGNSFLYKMLRKKNITLNGGKAEGRELLQQGDVVRMFFSGETYRKFAGSAAGQDYDNAQDSSDQYTGNAQHMAYLRAYRELGNISVVWEDGDIVVLDKPAGILTQKAKDTDLSLNEWLVGYLLETGSLSGDELSTFKPSVCNRLDRNTSGLVLCGKSLAGLQHLSEMLRGRELSKFYLTICMGGMREAVFLDGYIHKDGRTNRTEVTPNPVADALPIQTVCRPIATNGKYTLLEVELITGKTHQIRAHLADIGHPVIGDYKYGNRTANDLFKSSYGLGHQLLHAYRVVFPDGREVTAPCPALFQRIAGDLGLAAKEDEE